MAEFGGDPWSKAWQAWIAQARMAAKFAPAGAPGNPLEAAMAGLRSFGAAVSAAVAGAAPQAQAGALADYIDALRRAGDNQPGSEWTAVPFLWSAGLLDSAGAQGWRGVFDTGVAWTRELLDLPALGPQREWQEAVKGVVRARLAEQTAYQQLLTQQQRAQALALRRFAGYLRDPSGEPVTSLRMLYDAWIGIAERAYRDVVMDASYSRDFGAWVDSANATRLALRRLEERVAETLDQPQQGAIETLVTRQAELQAEVEHLRSELARLVQTAPLAAVPPVATEAETETAAVEGTVERRATSPKDRPASRVRSAAAARTTKATGARVTNKSAPAQRRPPSAPRPHKPPARHEFDIADILGEAD